MSNSFKCGECDGKTEVTDSRPNSLNGIRRRRRCLDCGFRFTTMEFFAGDSAKTTFVQVFLQYEKLSTESRQITRLLMDVLTKAEGR